MRTRLSLWLILLMITGWGYSRPLQADIYLYRIENFYQPKHQLYLSPQFTYFYSQSNYNMLGSTTAFSGAERYTRLLTDVSGAYAVNSYFTFFGRFSWLKNDVTLANGTGGNSFGPGDQTVGMLLRLRQQNAPYRKQRATLDLQFQTDLPLYKNQSDILPYAGDGSTDLTFSFFLGIPVFQFHNGIWKLQAGGGYTTRAAGFSKLLQWNLSMNYNSLIQSKYFFGLSVYGMQATQAKAMTHAGEGSLGSYITNSPSPELIGVRGKVEHSIGSEKTLFIALDKAISGKNAPSGWTTLLGATVRFGSDDKAITSYYTETKPAAPAETPSIPPAHKIVTPKQEFVTYTLEAHITRASDRLNLIKIDKGSQDEVAVGQIFDIYNLKNNGSAGESIARAECITVQKSQAVLRITEYYKEVWIEEGFLAKRPLP